VNLLNDNSAQDARRLAAAAEVADFFPADYNEREILAIAERALAGADGAVAVVPRSELDELRAEIERLRAAALAIATREVPGFIKNGRHWQTVDGAERRWASIPKARANENRLRSDPSEGTKNRG
jgi:hypothetical protein